MADNSGEFSESEFEQSGANRMDDDEFDYGDSYEQSMQQSAEDNRNNIPTDTMRSTAVANQHYDEAVELSSEGSVDQSVESPPKAARPEGFDRGDTPPKDDDNQERGEYAHDDSDVEIPGARPTAAGAQAASFASGGAAAQPARGGGGGGGGRPPQPAMMAADDDDDEESSSEDEDETSGMQSGAKPVAGGYNPDDYRHLAVSEEVRELFNYIGRYKPHNIELETKLKPFIPEYIPSIGEIDAFLKPGRPDGKPDPLGFKRLDEPSSHQTDPVVLKMQLRSHAKKSNLEPVTVRYIEHADKNPEAITRWINSINDLHKNKPPPQVHYSKAMPDIEALMQEWPPEFEEKLSQLELPSAELKLDVANYAKVACSLLDIPVYSSTIQSLHVLFTLFAEFRENQHFGGGEGQGNTEMAPQIGVGAGAAAGGEPQVMTFD